VTEPAIALVCDKCGASPAPGLPAVAGGTHYVQRARRYDASKRGAATVRVVTCGHWIERPT
jgi:hypothetical protein